MAVSTQIMHAFQFTPADLAANQQGVLGESQLRRSRQALTGGGLFALLLVLIVGGLLVVTMGDILAVIALLVIGLAVALGLLLVLPRLLGSSAVISSVEGVAHLDTARRPAYEGKWYSGVLTIDGKEFLLANDEQYNALKAGQAYRVYYVEGELDIYSIETLD